MAGNKFLHIKDFYNWIKKDEKHVPVDWRYFSVNFYPYEYDVVNVSHRETLKENKDENYKGTFFQQHADEFERFRYHVQKIDFPKLAYVSETGEAISSPEMLASIFGKYSGLKNSFLGVDKQIMTISLLNTQQPIHEHFIYEWMRLCMKSKIDDGRSPIPRVNMTVNFWRADQVARMTKEIEDSLSPDFIYYVRGMFPLSMELGKAIQSAGGGGDNNRAVDFSYNELIVLGSKEQIDEYKLAPFKVDFSGKLDI